MQTNRIYYKMHPTFHYRLSLCELGCNAKFNEVEFQVNSYAQLTDTDNRVVKAWVEGGWRGPWGERDIRNTFNNRDLLKK